MSKTTFAVGLAAAALTTATLAYATWRVHTLEQGFAAVQQELHSLTGEMTLYRLERSAQGQGPAALLERLKVYAPYMSSANVTEPDHKMGMQRIEEAMRAFETLGKDAFLPVRERFDQLDPKRDFDEMKALLQAACRADHDAGVNFVRDVLLGQVKPNPRLRWVAADRLLVEDLPLARQTLRQILLTESSRGIDQDRAVAHNVPILDPAAYATTGFHNFLLHYLRSQDPDAESVLLEVLTRAGQDVPTLQVAIEALGERKSVAAAKPIEQLYQKPPGVSDNAIFLNKCIDALVAIRGNAIVDWLERELGKAQNPVVQKQISFHLSNLK